MLAPMTFPMDMPMFPDDADITATVNSGNEVKLEIKMKPNAIWDMPKYLVNFEALSTTTSADLPNIPRAKIKTTASK